MKKGKLPAFARPRGEGGYKYNEAQEGISTRLYIAIKAMQGILSAIATREIISTVNQIAHNEELTVPELIAKDAFEYADAILKQEEK